jgi:PIN domain nuclease of toxin-antitoxin system
LKLLLDTHTLLWWATLDRRLSAKARRSITDDKTDVFVSAASAWEIATKVRIGRLEWPAAAGTINAYVLGQEFRPLLISLEHAERAGQLQIAHRDPFDRMLIAQAQTEDLWLVSNEKVFDSAGVRRVW